MADGMPLVRYEVRCEHSLANPDLYRTVDRYDSEGLLEGMAIGGLVGLVRQLGDLAEFAAEIFHGLHVDVMTIVSRGKDLKARVARLEADLPAVEKALLSEASQCRFAYTARSKCRLSLPMDQNLCAQGELPPFVRGFYDDCRGPPRLFLLDKFDKAGRGACVKRYTDPTYFRITWATAQLERAEQAERERLAEQERRNSENNPSKKAGPLTYRRERVPSVQLEDLEGFIRDSDPDPRSEHLHRVVRISFEDDLTPDRPRPPEEPESLDATFRNRQVTEMNEGPVLDPVKITGKDIENEKLRRRTRVEYDADGEPSDEEEEEEEAKCFMDTLTTMSFDADSEADFRSPRNARGSVDSRTSVDSETSSQTRLALVPQWVTPLKVLVLKAHEEGRRHTSPSRRSVGVNQKGDFTPLLRLEKPDVPIAGPEPGQESEASGGSSGSQPAIDHQQEARYADKLIENELNITSHNELETQESYVKLTEAQLKDSSKLSMITQRAAEKFANESHDSISLQDVFRALTRAKVEEQVLPAEARDQSPMPENEVSHVSRQDNQSILENAQQDVCVPKSRRLWARNNDSQVATSGILLRVLPLKLNGGVYNDDKLRARLLNDGEHSQEEIISPRALVQLEGEEVLKQDSEISSRIDCEMACNSSSNASSPYTNISSSSVVEDDGCTSSASESSPKGPNFFALLSPPESPSRNSRGLMGSHASYNTSSQFGRDSPKAPPTIPFLSLSPTVSRFSSFSYEPPVSFVDYSRPPPQLVSPPLEDINLSLHTSDGPAASSSQAPDKLKDVSTSNPSLNGVVAGLQAEANRSQPSRQPNSVVRPRTWNDRSEHNVAATLRAIRQAAAVQSDDTGNEDNSKDS